MPSPTFLLQNMYTDHEGAWVGGRVLGRPGCRGWAPASVALRRHGRPAPTCCAACTAAGFHKGARANSLPCPASTFSPLPAAGPPIHHFDLYRLQGGAPDLARLDLPASFAQAVCLVEWPERLAAAAAAAAAASAGGNGRGVPQPREPLEVRISILSPEEQAALAARLQAEAAAAQQRHAAGGAAEAGPGGGSGSEDEEEESGGDARWRRIQLAAAGARWRPRLQLLRRYLAEEGAALGCHLEPQGGEPA